MTECNRHYNNDVNARGKGKRKVSHANMKAKPDDILPAKFYCDSLRNWWSMISGADRFGIQGSGQTCVYMHALHGRQ